MFNTHSRGKTCQNEYVQTISGIQSVCGILDKSILTIGELDLGSSLTYKQGTGHLKGLLGIPAFDGQVWKFDFHALTISRELA